MNDKKQSIIDELNALVIEGPWRELIPFFNKGKLLICQDKARMIEIGAMLVLDQDEGVGQLAEVATLMPPSNENIEEWNDQIDQKLFEFLEIPPYCLAYISVKGKKREPV